MCFVNNFLFTLLLCTAIFVVKSDTEPPSATGVQADVATTRITTDRVKGTEGVSGTVAQTTKTDQNTTGENSSNTGQGKNGTEESQKESGAVQNKDVTNGITKGIGTDQGATTKLDDKSDKTKNTGVTEAITGITKVTGNLTGITETGIAKATGNLTGITETGITKVTGNFTGITETGITKVTGNFTGITETGITKVTGNFTGITATGITKVTGNLTGITGNKEVTRVTGGETAESKTEGTRGTGRTKETEKTSDSSLITEGTQGTETEISEATETSGTTNENGSTFGRTESIIEDNTAESIETTSEIDTSNPTDTTGDFSTSDHSETLPECEFITDESSSSTDITGMSTDMDGSSENSMSDTPNTPIVNTGSSELNTEITLQDTSSISDSDVTQETTETIETKDCDSTVETENPTLAHETDIVSPANLDTQTTETTTQQLETEESIANTGEGHTEPTTEPDFISVTDELGTGESRTMEKWNVDHHETFGPQPQITSDRAPISRDVGKTDNELESTTKKCELVPESTDITMTTQQIEIETRPQTSLMTVLETEETDETGFQPQPIETEKTTRSPYRTTKPVNEERLENNIFEGTDIQKHLEEIPMEHAVFYPLEKDNETSEEILIKAINFIREEFVTHILSDRELNEAIRAIHKPEMKNMLATLKAHPKYQMLNQLLLENDIGGLDYFDLLGLHQHLPKRSRVKPSFQTIYYHITRYFLRKETLRKIKKAFAATDFYVTLHQPALKKRINELIMDILQLRITKSILNTLEAWHLRARIVIGMVLAIIGYANI